MIKKLTSHELNNIFNSSTDKLEALTTDIKNIKSNFNKTMKLLRYELQYTEEEINKLKNIESAYGSINTTEQSRYMTSLITDIPSKYIQFGAVVTPLFKKTPVNVFNVITIADEEAFYRDIALVRINESIKPEYVNILKHDNITNKELFFEEIINNDCITIEVELDSSKTFGRTDFNVIEIDSFLNGSYDIESIKIYTSNNEEVFEEYKDFKNSGKSRIILNKTYDFIKVRFTIKINYNSTIENSKIYPFALKHIYFYKADFSTDSYSIVKINRNDYIDTIDDEIILVSPNAAVKSSITNEGIELYLNCNIEDNDKVVLMNKIEPSQNQSIKPISINVKTIYAKIPLKNNSLYGICFNTKSKVWNKL